MDKDTFVVAIGASAGGLEAIEQFFKKLSANPDVAFVIVQHLSPDYKSLMGELLSRHTTLPIFSVEDGMSIERNCIYLIPPAKNMSVYSGRLYLSEQPKTQHPNLPIDIFFRSLAQDLGKHAIGVILSGTGSDGSLGIKAIKESGGIIMAQDINTAKFDGMPRNAIATGMVDYVLPPSSMPETILKYTKHPIIIKGKEHPKDLTSDQSLLRILHLVRDRTGVDFTFYKPNTILRRLEKRLGINQIENFMEYLEFLENSPKEAHILYKDLLIGVTQFFRDTDAFNLLKNKMIPKLLDRRDNSQPIRIWCVGCSTGEEAYSIAILLAEYMEKKNQAYDVKLFATDIDKDFIETASIGIYPESIVTDVSPERLEKYFVKTSNGYQVSETIRRMVIYAQQNIIKDPPFSKIDLITCRNMLIYLNPEMQRKIISMFYYSLIPGGGLFLGASEALGDASAGFEVMSSKWKLFTQKSGYKAPYISNYMLPLSKKNTGRIQRQDFGYLMKDQQLIPDNILTDLLELTLPPSVIVNEHFRVVHLFSDVNEFVKLPSGKATYDVLNMVKKDLAVVLSSMLNKVVKDKKEVIFKDIKLKEQNISVNIYARPLKDKISHKLFIVVSFEKVAETIAPQNGKQKFDLKTEIDQHYMELEKELQYAKENLQATIEELETSNEELQSTNEELVASNEELQSTNEELQSVNEELYTVNSEYQKKIDELTELNNDMNNLLSNTSIGLLFLDRNLKIRKYTKMASRIINIIEMDIGRPIQHISMNVEYENFQKDILSVRDNLKPVEREVVDHEDRWCLVRILPYRSPENAVDGIAITIFDITEKKEHERRIEREKNLFYSILENSPVGKAVVDKSGKITFANKRAEEIFELSLSHLKNRKYNDSKWNILDVKGKKIPPKELPFSLIMAGVQKVKNYCHSIQKGKGEPKFIRINGSPMYDKIGVLSGAVFTIEEISEKEAKSNESE